MATKNKSVSIATIEKLLKINQQLPTRLTTRLPTISHVRSPTRSPSPLRLNDLKEDIRYKIAHEYSNLVNKPKNIAEELIKTIISDFENEKDREKVNRERDKAKTILETIADINIIDEIYRFVIENKQLISNNNVMLSILYLINVRKIELEVVEQQKQKLKDLNYIVKTLESQFTKIKKDTKSKSNSAANKILNDVDTIFLIIKEEQDKAKKILTRDYLKTLNINISDKQRMIEKTVKEVEDNVKKELDKANNLLEQIKK
jgi:hypothetical protein